MAHSPDGSVVLIVAERESNGLVYGLKLDQVETRIDIGSNPHFEPIGWILLSSF